MTTPLLGACDPDLVLADHALGDQQFLDSLLRTVERVAMRSGRQGLLLRIIGAGAGKPGMRRIDNSRCRSGLTPWFPTAEASAGSWSSGAGTAEGASTAASAVVAVGRGDRFPRSESRVADALQHLRGLEAGGTTPRQEGVPLGNV